MLSCRFEPLRWNRLATVAFPKLGGTRFSGKSAAFEKRIHQ
ncbi:MAG: hypothetical protein WCT05_14785 [Lentisphaeria bacterium]